MDELKKEEEKAKAEIAKAEKEKKEADKHLDDVLKREKAQEQKMKPAQKDDPNKVKPA